MNRFLGEFDVFSCIYLSLCLSVHRGVPCDHCVFVQTSTLGDPLVPAPDPLPQPWPNQDLFKLFHLGKWAVDLRLKGLLVVLCSLVCWPEFADNLKEKKNIVIFEFSRHIVNERDNFYQFSNFMGLVVFKIPFSSYWVLRFFMQACIIVLTYI